MPAAPLTVCSKPGCGLLRRRNEACARGHGPKTAKAESDRARGSFRQRGYSSAWDALSKAWRFEHPLCAPCEREGRVTVAEMVDHIVPVKQAPERLLDRSNLESMCLEHHARKSAIDGSGAGWRNG